MTLLGTEACPSVSPHMYIVSDHYCIVLVTPTELVFFLFLALYLPASVLLLATEY